MLNDNIAANQDTYPNIMKSLMPVIITFVFLVVGAGLFFIVNGDDTPSISDSQRRATVAKQVEQSGGESLLLVGEPDAKATVVEYYDYKCPACNSFHRTTGREIEAAYVDDGLAKIDLRLTPVIGPDSANAGRGAYCANEQGLFSEYHNTVMDHMWDNYYGVGDFSVEFQNYLTTNKLSEILLGAGVAIDEVAFTECTDSDRYNPFLDENLLLAAEDSIQGTPGFAIGDQSFVGGQPFSVFKTLIDIQLR